MAQLNKPIIHFQIPLFKQDGRQEVDNFAVSLAGVDFFKKWVAEQIGDSAYIIATPFDIDVIGAEVEKVKLDEMTLEEFFKKHDIKDGVAR